MIKKILRNGYEFQFDPESPFLRFKGGSRPKLPPRPDPAPTPESIQEGAGLAGETEARLRKKKKGRRSLILTEGGFGVSEANSQAKQSLLG